MCVSKPRPNQFSIICPPQRPIWERASTSIHWFIVLQKEPGEIYSFIFVPPRNSNHWPWILYARNLDTHWDPVSEVLRYLNKPTHRGGGRLWWWLLQNQNQLSSISNFLPPLSAPSLFLSLSFFCFFLHSLPSFLPLSLSPPPCLSIPAALLVGDVGSQFLIVAGGVWEGDPEAVHGPQPLLQFSNLCGGGDGAGYDSEKVF